jgi:TnpA family transposase
MSRLNILSFSEQKAFETPKELTGDERKIYFRKNSAINNLLISINSSVNKVAFSLMLYHFKISKKFFPISMFSNKDLKYISHVLDVDLVEEQCFLENKTFNRYKHQVLEHTGYKAFDLEAKKLIGAKAHNLAIQYIRPKVIFNDCIKLLLEQRIEIPKYHALLLIISNILQQYKDSLLAMLNEHLSIETKEWLNELLLFDEEQSISKLTALKGFYQSVKPKEIKFNTQDFEKLQKMHDKLYPIIQGLPINARGIEYYATIVIKSDIFRIKRREDSDRYLHLIAFIVYQYATLHDTLMDILLKSVSSFNSSSKREHKEVCYELRTRHEQNVKDYIVSISKQNRGIKVMYTVHKKKISVERKYSKIANILDYLFDTIEKVDEHLVADKSRQGNAGYFNILEKKSRSLQSKLTPILKVLRFDDNQLSASKNITKAIQHFQERDGSLITKPPMDFLSEEERLEVHPDGKTRISLYKALLFRKINDNIKSGSLNLQSSYKFKALDEYMISKEEWNNNKDDLLEQSGLEKFRDCKEVLRTLEAALNKGYIRTNENIINKSNEHLRINDINDYVLNTPPIENVESGLADYLPGLRTVSMQEVLSTVAKLSGFLKSFEYYKASNNKQANSDLLIAGIMSLGYGMGNNDIAAISKNMSSSALENTVNWCFTTDNIRNAIDEILRTTAATGIPNFYINKNEKLHTSSDGQKWKVANDSLNAHYSFKYYGKDQGVTVGSFIDKRHLLFYSTVMSSSIREAAYVIDGLMENTIVKSEIHSTDTDGYSEIVFGVTHFLSIFAAPRIKGIKHQVLSMFPSGYKVKYKESGYKILPTHVIKIKTVEESYDEILRFMATIKLNRSTASQLLSRLNSSSTQHRLYQALKEFGKIIKSIFILKYLDDVKLRQSIEKQLNLVENNNKFSKAIAQENDLSFVQQTQEEQIMAESCRRLMKATIICWNSLYLYKILSKEQQENKRKEIIKTIQRSSLMTWKHVNLKGEYDFSDEKIRDKYDLKLDDAITL